MIPVEEGQVVEVRRDGRRVHRLRRATRVDPEPIDGRLGRGPRPEGRVRRLHAEGDPRAAGARSATRSSGASSNGRLALDELQIADDVLREVDKVFVVACGTAFHSGLVAKYAIEHWTRLPVEIEIASEFRYRDPVLGPDTLTLAVSQSGETIDTLEAARHARRQGSQVIAVTNTVGSSLAREADGVLYTHAGPEIGGGRRRRRSRRRWCRSTWWRSTWRRSAARCSRRRSPRSWTGWTSCPSQVQRALELDGAGPRARRAVPGRARRPVHRAAHGLPGRARRRAEAEGALLRPRGGVPGRRAEARPDRARRGGRAGRRGRDRVPRLPEDAVEHPGGPRARRRGDRDRDARATSRSARLADHVLEVPRDAGAALARRRSPFRCSCSRTTSPSSGAATSTSPGTSRRASRSSSRRGIENRGRTSSAPASSSLAPWRSSGLGRRHLRDRPDGARARAAPDDARAGVHPRGASPTATRRRAPPSPTRDGSRRGRPTIKALGGYRGKRWQDIRVTPAPARRAVDRASRATRSAGRHARASRTC